MARTVNKNKPPNENAENSGQASGNSGRRRLPFWKKLAFLSVVLVLLFLACELLLVVLGVSFPLLYQPDEFCATRLKNNLNVRYIEEGNSVVRTNSDGFRDKVWQLQKPDDTFRIAVVGDSFCEAIQVKREDSFCYQLEKMLRERGNSVEVMNFGISGFGTAQEFEMLRHRVLKYQPDLVILAVFLGNDVGDNSRTINPGQIKPYFDLVDGKLKLDNSFLVSEQFRDAQSSWTQFKSSLINSSRVLQLVNKLYSRLRSRGGRRANIGIGLDPDLYRPPESDQWKEAWEVTEATIQAFYDECQNADAKCIVMTLSNPIQVHPDPEMRRAFAEENRIESLFYPDERVRQFCASRKIPLLQLAKTLHDEADQSDPPIYFHGFQNTQMGTGHWNERGHQRVANILKDHLIKTIFN